MVLACILALELASGLWVRPIISLTLAHTHAHSLSPRVQTHSHTHTQSRKTEDEQKTKLRARQVAHVCGVELTQKIHKPGEATASATGTAAVAAAARCD